MNSRLLQYWYSFTSAFLLVGCLLLTNLAWAQLNHVNEYEQIGYDNKASHNRVARLNKKLQSGEIQLEYQGHRGYLDSLLEALDISHESQVLVFSKTSLQYQLIGAQTPRALYFNEDTYIGWVQNSTIVEVATTDEKLGMVFYVFNNTPEALKPIERLDQKCLVCHDSYGTMGGGVPLLMARSSIYNTRGENLKEILGDENTQDHTPLEDRWGGWYVTGRHGEQQHLGNVQLEGPQQLEQLDQARTGNLETLRDAGFFDTSPYPRDTSDIVALMVLEHQLTIQNQLTYIKFKAPVVLHRMGFSEATSSPDWDSMPEKGQQALRRMLDELVQKLLMVDAIKFSGPISGTPEFRQWFEAQGPRDSENRSLRDLDLENGLFRYPLSYLVYSADFAALPAYAMDYVTSRIAQVLNSETSVPGFEHISRNDKQFIREILTSTSAGLLQVSGDS